MRIWRAFWGEMNTPGSYPADPYGAAANQLGHMALGAVAAAVLCMGWAAVTGEMPYRLVSGIALVLAYTVAIEWWRQGWQRADSIIDTLFVALGIAAPMASLREAAIDPIRLDPDPPVFFWWLAVAATCFALYIYPRARRAYRKD